MLLGSGCVGVNQIAICDGLRSDIDALADALLIDGGDMSVTTGQVVVAKFDAGCGK